MTVHNFRYLWHAIQSPKYQPTHLLPDHQYPPALRVPKKRRRPRSSRAPGPLMLTLLLIIEKAYCLVGSVSRAKISNKKDDLYKSSFLYS